MRPDDILELLRVQPFQPFRLRLTDGMVYEIRHPEMIKVGRSKAWVFFHESDDPLRLLLRSEAISLLHITRLEPMDTPAKAPGAAGGNGE
jgi:hypothetical protein